MSRFQKLAVLGVVGACGWLVFGFAQNFVSSSLSSLHNPYAEPIYYVIRYAGAAVGFVALGLMLRLALKLDTRIKQTVPLGARAISLCSGITVAVVFWWGIDLALLVCLFFLPGSWDSPNVLGYLRAGIRKLLPGSSESIGLALLACLSVLVIVSGLVWVDWDALSFVHVIVLAISIGFSAGFIPNIAGILIRANHHAEPLSRV